MKKSIRTGISFGLVSGVLTTLGLLIGLGVGTNSEVAVVGGVLTIAIADALSDALGIHLSQEAANNSSKHVWEATLATFISKFTFALTFLIPIFLFNLREAVFISVLWGLGLVSYLSYLISKKENKISVMTEHLVLFVLVVVLSYLVGRFVNIIFY